LNLKCEIKCCVAININLCRYAASIKNKPEVNQRLTKTALIKDMNNEIDRLVGRCTLYQVDT
jgi:hypothetical protein